MDFELTPDEMEFLLHTRTACGLTVILDDGDRASLAQAFVGSSHDFVPDEPPVFGMLFAA
jgi:hypothetical protein